MISPAQLLDGGDAGHLRPVQRLCDNPRRPS
jgi:hypothetical protein